MAKKSKKSMRTSKNTPAEVLKSRHAFYKSWLIVADELGYNKGVLCAVANGKRKPSRGLIELLNKAYGLHLPYPVVTVHAIPCRHCGEVKVSRRCDCRKRRTFDDNAAAYDAWLSSPRTQAQLAAMLEWAETPQEQRGKWKEKHDSK